MSAPKALIQRIAAEVMMVDRQGDPAMEVAIAEFIEAGELHRHTRRHVVTSAVSRISTNHRWMISKPARARNDDL